MEMGPAFRRCAPCLALLAVLLGAWTAAWPFTVDDAYIAARYALRLASGRGYTYDEGEVSDGVTGPLWLLPLSAAAAVGLDPIVVAKLSSALTAWFALASAVRRARARALGRRGAWLVALIGASSLPFVVWSIAGLETGLATLCATWLALAVSARPRPHGLAAGAACAALCWLRPELLPFAGCLLWGLAMRARRAGLWAATLGLAGALSVVAFRLALFGHVLPMSASAKPALLGNGLAYLGQALASPRAWCLALLLAAALAGRARDAALFAAALVVHACAVVLAGGDWMPGGRLFAPIVPTLALAVASTLGRLALRRPRALVAWGCALIVASAPSLIAELREARRAGVTRTLRLPALAARVCAAPAPIALVDLGALGFSCPNRSFVDLGGLTEPEVAYAPGGHLDKRIDGAWLRARAPGLFVLHSRERPRVDLARRLRWFAGYPVERRVLGFSWLRQDYEVVDIFEYGPAYFYVLLARREQRSETVKSRMRSVREAAPPRRAIAAKIRRANAHFSARTSLAGAGDLAP